MKTMPEIRWRNTDRAYGLIARILHWGIAAAILFMLYAGYFRLHKATGMAILFLVLIRVLWRVMDKTPIFPETGPRWQVWAAHLAHGGLYALMLLIPLSGWLMSSAAGKPVSFYGWFDLPVLMAPDDGVKHFLSAAHYWLTRMMIGLIGLHGLAALYHQFIRRDGVLRRML